MESISSFFRTALAWRPPAFWRKPGFVYPVLPAPRTAVLEPRFRSQGNIRVFPGWCAEAARWEPAAIAGGWDRIRPLLDMKIESLTHAVIVLSPPDKPLLSAAQRQRVWDAFRVPVFEQIVAANGLLLAAECQAHQGLHIESPRFAGGSVAGGNGAIEKVLIETTVCGCGRTGPRLKPVSPAEHLHIIAAYAR